VSTAGLGIATSPVKYSTVAFSCTKPSRITFTTSDDKCAAVIADAP